MIQNDLRIQKKDVKSYTLKLDQYDIKPLHLLIKLDKFHEYENVLISDLFSQALNNGVSISLSVLLISAPLSFSQSHFPIQFVFSNHQHNAEVLMKIILLISFTDKEIAQSKLDHQILKT